MATAGIVHDLKLNKLLNLCFNVYSLIIPVSKLTKQCKYCRILINDYLGSLSCGSADTARVATHCRRLCTALEAIYCRNPGTAQSAFHYRCPDTRLGKIPGLTTGTAWAISAATKSHRYGSEKYPGLVPATALITTAAVAPMRLGKVRFCPQNRSDNFHCGSSDTVRGSSSLSKKAQVVIL